MNNELKQFKKRKKKKKNDLYAILQLKTKPYFGSGSGSVVLFQWQRRALIQRERGREMDGAVNRELDSGGKGSSMAAANGEERENVKVSSKKMNRVY